MELIDTFAEREISELDHSAINLRRLAITNIFRNSARKRTIHDGFHPFTAMSCHLIVHDSGGKRVDLIQNSFHLLIDVFPSEKWVIEEWMTNTINLPYPTLEEAAGYCNEEERQWN